MSSGKELRIPAGAALQVSKALAQLGFVACQYGRTLLTPAKRQEYGHDFEVILTFGNLRRIGAEFLSKGTIVSAMWVEFDSHSGKFIDSAEGVEAPFIPRGVVDDHRVLMSERDEARTDDGETLGVVWFKQISDGMAAGTETQQRRSLIRWLTIALVFAFGVLVAVGFAHGQSRAPMNRRLATVEQDTEGLTNVTGDLLRSFEELHRQVRDLGIEIATLKTTISRGSPEADRLAKLEERLTTLEGSMAATAPNGQYLATTKGTPESSPVALLSGRWLMGDEEFEFIELHEAILVRHVNGPGIQWARGRLDKPIRGASAGNLYARGMLRGVLENDPIAKVRTVPVSIRGLDENTATLETEIVEWNKFGQETRRSPVTTFLKRVDTGS